MGKTQKLDIIWNMSLVCPWDCEICCVDAVHVTRNGKRINLRSDNLAINDHFEATGDGTIYDQAARRRQEEGFKELSGKTFKFLKDCLKRVNKEMPYRGPTHYEEGNFRYINSVEGDISRFNGIEKIFFRDEEIYQRIYHGGLIL